MHLKYEYTRLLAETFSASSYLSYKSHRVSLICMIFTLYIATIFFYILSNLQIFTIPNTMIDARETSEISRMTSTSSFSQQSKWSLLPLCIHDSGQLWSC